MIRSTVFSLAACAALCFAASPAAAEQIRCKVSYDLEGWSILYKYGRGSGRITCSNGQTARVGISTHGGGATLGTQKVIGGRGRFSAVSDISELFGSYAEVDAHVGAGGSADARVMVKNNVNLTLVGNGQGISLGIAFGSFTIRPE